MHDTESIDHRNDNMSKVVSLHVESLKPLMNASPRHARSPFPGKTLDHPIVPSPCIKSISGLFLGRPCGTLRFCRSRLLAARSFFVWPLRPEHQRKVVETGHRHSRHGQGRQNLVCQRNKDEQGMENRNEQRRSGREIEIEHHIAPPRLSHLLRFI